MSTVQKRIFISDIHLGDARSFDPPHPYGWLREKNLAHLAAFLGELLGADDLAEVIIVGDLFDTWVIPTDQDPLTSVQAICDNPPNRDVIEALRQLAARSLLTYVAGNHDLTIFAPDIPNAQERLEHIFPHIRANTDPYLPYSVYRRGKLVAEHGNRYGLFNAADTWTNFPGLLPLGYFISRLAAYKVSREGPGRDFHEIFFHFVMQFKDGIDFIKDVFMAIALDAGLTAASPINMQDIGSYPDTVGGVAALYADLIAQWQRERPDLDWRLAIVGDVGDLYPAALHQYFSLFGSQENIVIFGHTHKADLKKHYFLEAAPHVKDLHLDLPCRSIYANCGTWVDTGPYCTYVETREDTNRKRHYVRLKTYPDHATLQEAFVRL